MPLSTRSRRRFLKETALAAASAFCAARPVAAIENGPSKKLHLAQNQYPWLTFYRREGRDLAASLDAALAEVAQSGGDGFEPLATSAQQIDRLAPLLEKHGLQMRSLYVNSTLHEAEKVAESSDLVLAIAEEAKALGTRIMVTIPARSAGVGTKTRTTANWKSRRRHWTGWGPGSRRPASCWRITTTTSSSATPPGSSTT